jgi:hypothetical protein
VVPGDRDRACAGVTGVASYLHQKRAHELLADAT